MIFTDTTERIYVGLSVWEKEGLPIVKNEILDFVTHTLDRAEEMDGKQLRGLSNIIRIVRDMEDKGEQYVIKVTPNMIMDMTDVDKKLDLEETDTMIKKLEKERNELKIEVLNNIEITK